MEDRKMIIDEHPFNLNCSNEQRTGSEASNCIVLTGKEDISEAIREFFRMGRKRR